jgi:hypothetical protein
MRELLHGRELHPLRSVRHELAVGPFGRRDAPAEVGESLFRKVDAEGAIASPSVVPIVEFP